MKRHLSERHYKRIGLSVFALSMMLGAGMTAQAQEEDKIKDGIFISGVEVSGMTKEEATQAVWDYVEELGDVSVILEAAEGNEVQVAARELGLTWSNLEVVDEAMEIGMHGNVIQRYKIMKDLQHENQHFELEFDFDIVAIDEVLRTECAKFDQEAIDLTLKRINGEFVIEEGQIGYMLDVYREKAPVQRNFAKHALFVGFFPQLVMGPISKYSDVGNVLALTVDLSDGTSKTFTGDRARTALNSATLGVTIGSHRYTINGGSTEDTVNINGAQVELDDLYVQGDGKKAKKIDVEDGVVALTANGIEAVTITEPAKIENEDGVYVINGTGSGHNIGLSQEGARSMAEEGFTFEEIIEFYFTDAEVDYYDPN